MHRMPFKQVLLSLITCTLVGTSMMLEKKPIGLLSK